MRLDRCEWETAVLESVRAARWPHACDDDLRAHVAQCLVCAELVRVAEALQQEDAATRAEVTLPAPEFIWWKAQIRARRMADERAAAPINMAAQVAGVCAAFSLLGLALWQWPRIANWWNWSKRLPLRDLLGLGNASAGLLWTPYLLLAGSMLLGLALASFVLYLVLARE
jgi:hypothetical protein